MAWTIEYEPIAKTQLRKLDSQVSRRVKLYMERRVAVLEDPRSIGVVLKSPLVRAWRYRVGNYRVVCKTLDHMHRIVVVRIGRRDDVYRIYQDVYALDASIPL